MQPRTTRRVPRRPQLVAKLYWPVGDPGGFACRACHKLVYPPEPFCQALVRPVARVTRRSCPHCHCPPPTRDPTAGHRGSETEWFTASQRGKLREEPCAAPASSTLDRIAQAA